KYQRRAMLADQYSDAVVDFFPDFIRHHRFERRPWNFNCEIKSAHVTSVDNRAARCAIAFNICRAYKETSNVFDRFLRCREANANQRLFDQRLESFDRQREM